MDPEPTSDISNCYASATIPANNGNLSKSDSTRPCVRAIQGIHSTNTYGK